MVGKPFRPPLLRKIEKSEVSAVTNDSEPQTKKRRVDLHDEDGTQAEPRLVFKKPGLSFLPRKPLLAVENLAAGINATEPPDEGIEGHYNVLWYETIYR